MRIVVVGAGAWGLPAAAELARRGHDVTLLDRHGPASQLMSSSGPTRLWRVSHPDRLRVRLGLRSVEAEGVPRTVVEPDDVARFFPGLRPDGRVAIWQETAGPVLARAALDAQAGLFAMARGTSVVGPVIREVDVSDDDVVLRAEDGREFRADVAVLAPGPGAGALFDAMGIGVQLRPVLEQVCHVGHAPETDAMPCLYDGPIGDEPGMYAMPTPGRGYKLGIDSPLREWHEDDLDRVPLPEVSAAISARVVRNFTHLDPTCLDSQVCSWTESPDGRFVIDRIAGGRVVLAAGDSGEGFKFSALMGPVLADLAEGAPVDPDIAPFGLDRFAADGAIHGHHVLGR